MPRKVKVVGESESGRNQRFQDEKTGRQMSRADFVRRIEAGEYDCYHVRKVHGVKTPVSNPNSKESDNLG